ncbi:MAG TPA: radical SAM protein [Malonomonas sp.]
MTEPASPSEYRGFEQGPIRPPSEAASLLLRISRNCPWNRCTFCSIYKRDSFSLRPLEHILKDIDSVHHYLTLLQERANTAGGLNYHVVSELANGLGDAEQMALYAAYNWLGEGMQSIFLQDANSLVIKPAELVVILQHIRQCFPQVERITSYARSQTIDRISEDDLQRIAAAGLNRIHIGMESGSDAVLKIVQKGTDQAMHIRAGQKVKRVGMQLSEYVMPGLGGRTLSREHALETAAALNQIDADFIRLRTLAIPNHTELFNDWQDGSFVKLCDKEVAEEILLFLETLDGISSTVKSDHILNLFQEIEGRYPEDKAAMTGVIRRFFALSAEEQMLYQVGRRMGLFARLDDLQRTDRRQRAAAACTQFGITTDNIDTTITELMKRFI